MGGLWQVDFSGQRHAVENWRRRMHWERAQIIVTGSTSERRN
jgi:hypothetical protein